MLATNHAAEPIRPARCGSRDAHGRWLSTHHSLLHATEVGLRARLEDSSALLKGLVGQLVHSFFRGAAEKQKQDKEITHINLPWLVECTGYSQARAA